MKSKILIIITLFLVSCTQPKFDDRYVDIDFHNLEIKDFVEQVSEIIGKEIRIKEEIKGKTNFVSAEPILKDELIPLLNAILETKQLTLVNRGQYYTTVKSSSVPACYFGVDDSYKGQMKIVVFELDDLKASFVQSKIKPLLSKGANVTIFKKNNLLAITEYVSSLRSIKMLIDKLKSKSKSKINGE
jgi:general secretion pathway protein D